jgi:hypothetical protein
MLAGTIAADSCFGGLLQRSVGNHDGAIPGSGGFANDRLFANFVRVGCEFCPRGLLRLTHPTLEEW